MAKVKLLLQRKSIPVKIEMGRGVVKYMTGNPNFPNPNPPLNVIKTVTDDLESAHMAALRWDREKKAIQQAKLEEWEHLMTRLGDYVQSTSAGDASKILSAGMEVRKRKAPVGALPAPTKLQVSRPTSIGSAKLSWAKMFGARAFVCEACQLPIKDHEWQQMAFGSKSTAILKGLLPGKQYAFRVFAIGSAGRSPYSAVVRIWVG